MSFPQYPQYHQFGGYGYPPPPKKKKTGPVIAVISVVLAVTGFLVTGFAWPGWLITPAPTEPGGPGERGTPVVETPDLSTPDGTARALRARLVARDITAIATGLTCGAGQRKSEDGTTSLIELDIRDAIPPLDPTQPAEVRDTATTFELVAVRPIRSGDRGFEPGRERHIAEFTVTYQDASNPRDNTERTVEFRLTREHGNWLVCGIGYQGAESSTTAESPSGSSPADPNNTATAYLTAVNNRDISAAVALTCPSGTSAKILAEELIKVGGQLRLAKPVTLTSPESKTATMELVGTARGDTANMLGALWRAAPDKPWCVNLIQPKR
jgi:hypothetical protein